MSQTATKGPPAGYVEFLGVVQELHLAMAGTTKSAQKWALYGPKAAPFIRKEIERMKAHIANAEVAIAAIEGAIS